MWVPTLQGMMTHGDHQDLPTGLVFAAFMLCIAIGGKVFERVSTCYRIETIGLLTTVLALLSLLIPSVRVFLI